MNEKCAWPEKDKNPYKTPLERFVKEILQIPVTKFAEEIGRSESNIHRMMSGKTPLTMSMVEQLCNKYHDNHGITRDFLLGEGIFDELDDPKLDISDEEYNASVEEVKNMILSRQDAIEPSVRKIHIKLSNQKDEPRE